MADPTLHTVIDSVVTKLGVNVAGTVYQPDKVEAISEWPDMTKLVSAPGRTYYGVLVDTESPELRGLPDSGTLTGRLPLEVYAAYQVGAATVAPRWQIAADLSTDIEQKLIAAENAKATPIVAYVDPSVDMAITQDWTEQWVVVVYKFTLRYRKERATR